MSRNFAERHLIPVVDHPWQPSPFGKSKYKVQLKDAHTGVHGDLGNNRTRDEAYNWSRDSLYGKLKAAGAVD